MPPKNYAIMRAPFRNYEDLSASVGAEIRHDLRLAVFQKVAVPVFQEVKVQRVRKTYEHQSSFDRIGERAYNTFVKPAELIAKCAIDTFTKPTPQPSATYTTTAVNVDREVPVLRHGEDLGESAKAEGYESQLFLKSYCMHKPRKPLCVRLNKSK